MIRNNEIWVEIKRDVFRNASFRDINFIVQLLSWSPNGSTTKYHFFIQATQEYLISVPNYNQLADIDKELITNNINYAITSGKNQHPKYKITNKQNRQRNEFNIQEFVRFFQSRVLLILENSLNDSYFVKTIFELFGPKDANNKNKLIDFLNNDWIQFVNAGGWTNVKNYIKGRQEAVTYFAEQQGRNVEDFLRCFVLVDSDKLYADFNVERKDRLKTELEELGIKVHILNKRAMENYMPDAVIEQLPSFDSRYGQFQQWVNVYKYLSNEQKDYLSYQKGFEKQEKEKVNKPRTEQSQEIQNLYPASNENSISDANYEILDTGLKGFPAFKDEFPKFFKNRDYVNKDSLLQREGGTTATNEFLEIIEKIMDLL